MKVTASRFAYNTDRGFLFLGLNDIVRLEASGGCTHLYFANGKTLITAKVLKAFAFLQGPLGFVRTHRAHLLNRRHINAGGKGGRLVLKAETHVTISCRLKSSFFCSLLNAA